MGRIVKIVTIAVGCAVFAAALGLVALATPPGKAWLAGQIERSAAKAGIVVALGGVTGWPPFFLRAARLSLADAKGQFANVEDLAVDVDVGALLSGRLRLESLTAARIALDRMPETQGSGGGGSPPLVPVDRLAVANLELGPAIVGRSARLSMNGGLAVAGDRLDARLSATRTDGSRGSLELAATRAGAGAPYLVELSLAEDADGIAAGLFERRGGPAYELVAAAQFADGSGEGTLRLASERDAHFEGAFRIGPENGGYRLTVDGAGAVDELVPPAFADLLAGQVGISIDAAWSRPDDEALPLLDVAAGSIATDTLRIDASGRLGGAGSDLAVTARLERPDGGMIELPGLDRRPVQLRGLTLDGRVAPQDGRLRLDLLGRLAGLAVGDVAVPGVGLSLAVESDAIDPSAARHLPFALRVEVDRVETAGGSIEATDAEPILVTADGSLDIAALTADTDATLAIVGQSASFQGTIAAGLVEGEARLQAGELQRLAPALPLALSGGASGTAKGRFMSPDGIDLAVAISTEEIATGMAALDGLLAGEAEVSARLRRPPAGPMSISNLTVAGATLEAAGDIDLGDTLEGRLSGRIDDAGRLADNTRGAIGFEAEVAGTMARPRLEARLSMGKGAILGRSVEEAVIELSGAPDDDGWSGSVTADGQFSGQPLKGEARLVRGAGERLVADPIDFVVAGNRISGAIERGPDGLLVGALDVDAPDVASLAALGFTEATGAGAMRLVLAASNGTQSASMRFRAADLSIADIRVGAAEGVAEVESLFGTPRLTGDLSAQNVAAGSVRLDSVDVEASVVDGATRFEASATGPEVDLDASGTFRGDGDERVARLERLSGTAFGLPVALAEPATVRLGAETRVDAVVSAGGGRVRLNGIASPRLDLVAVFEGVALSTANRFASGLGAEGSASGRATITGTPAAPRINWEVDARGLRVATTRSAGLPPFALSGRGSGSPAATSIDATLSGSGVSLDLSGTVPLAGDSLDIRAAGTAPLALIGAAAGRELRFGGAARLDLAVTGRASAPAVSGTVDLSEAVVGDPATGFGIAGAAGRIRLDGRQAVVEQLTGRLAQGGTVSASGTVAIDVAAGLPADLTLTVTDGRYADGEVVNTTFSAELGITGGLLTDATVSGPVNLGRTEIRLPERRGSRATAIDVEHRNAPAGFEAPIQQSSVEADGVAGGGSLRLDLSVTSRSGIFVRGYGLDAELDGTVRVGGTSGRPDVVGGYTLRRGRLDFLGRRLNITRGQLTFGGGLVPFVDFAADTTAGTTSVTVLVTGRADAPQIELTSSPELPQEEILSLLLFNRSIGSLSALQAAQLVDALAQLSGAISGGGVFDRIRQATGLDDLDIREDEEGNTTVRVGRRLTDNVRVGVEQGEAAGSGRVTIDLDITRNLKARGEAGGDGEGKLGLTLEREY